MFSRSASSLLLLAAAALLGGAWPPAARGQDVLDGIAAVVNEDVITFSQVRELVGPAERVARESLKGEQLIEKIKEIRLRAINDLIDRQLILQEFKKNKFQMPEHVIEERLNTIVREEFGGDRSAFTRTLAAQGFTLDRFRQLETDKMIVQAMRSQMVKADPVVPENKIVEHYEKNRAEFTSEEQIHLRLIAIRKTEDENDARRKM
ncbi:MAG: SurA N-terminal domain-containing protein, partial [Verrucomicrobiota bacterium]|nr:SurA N-terminal domain-containing protein [Verrucomicrobiota bacterium]